jgi:hypothetical protein
MPYSWIRTLKFATATALLAAAPALVAQVILTSDNQQDAYTRIQSKLASAPETPDCSHPAFGPHITQVIDPDLQKYAFDFNIHVTPDNDRCVAFDRQRLEIKTEGNSSTPDYVKGFLGDSVTFRWQVKLAPGFQPSSSFTHIHQIKAYDGDASAPIITITPRRGSPNTLQLIHINSSGVTTTLSQTPLDPFVGIWVQGYEKITYGTHGTYSLLITRLGDGSQLFSYSNNDLDLWRNGTTVVRPKWGIYRSLNNSAQLRDEQAHYDRFCLAKGTDDCVDPNTLPEFTMAGKAFYPSTHVGSTAYFAIQVAPVRGFTDSGNFVVSGLPPGATANFRSTTFQNGGGTTILSVTTTADTPVGNYPLVVSAISGVLSHVATVNLNVVP